jgi:hypothetical protein
MTVFFKNQTFSVSRTTGQTINATGFYTTGSTSTFNVSGSFQPISGKDRQMLPEGVKETATHWFYSETALLIDDVITHTDGSKYQVKTIEVWQGFGLGLDHYANVLQYVEGS